MGHALTSICAITELRKIKLIEKILKKASKFLHEYSGHVFCLLRLGRLPWPYGLSLGWGRLLGAVRKCSAAVVGLDLVLGLSMVRRCSLKRSFKHRLVPPMYCKLQRLYWFM